MLNKIGRKSTLLSVDLRFRAVAVCRAKYRTFARLLAPTCIPDTSRCHDVMIIDDLVFWIQFAEQRVYECREFNDFVRYHVT